MKPLPKPPVFQILFLVALLLGVAVLYNSLKNAQENSKISGIAHNGVITHKSIFGYNSDVKAELYGVEFLPTSDEFSNSNAYFVSLVKQGILDVNWSFFSLGGIPKVLGRFIQGDMLSITAFQSENNYWSVVADLSADDMDAPFLISRNLDEPILIPEKESNQKPKLSKNPINQDFLLVVRVNGVFEKIDEEHLTWERLNPSGFTKRILHPGDPQRYPLEEAKKIGLSVFAQIAQNKSPGPDDWKLIPMPDSARSKNSNQYFVNLVTTGVINVSWDYFSAGRVPAAKGRFSKNPGAVSRLDLKTISGPQWRISA